MANNRVAELKETLQATKRATAQAIERGILTPVKSRPVVRNVFKEVEEGEEDGEEMYDDFGNPGSYEDDEDDEDDDEEGYEDDDYGLEDSLEESYEDDHDVGYTDDDTFAIRRAEAKLGLNDEEDDGGEAKSLYHRRAEQRAEAKNGGSIGHIVTPRVFIDQGEGGGGGGGGGGEGGGFSSPSRDDGAESKDSSPPSGLSDAVSPSARIEDRVLGLRRRCEDGLGRRVFDEAYSFLKRLQERGGVNGNIATDEAIMTPGGTVEGGEEEGEDDEEAVLEELTKILGEDKLHFWSLVDQLLFCEDLRKSK